ncbi:MAG: hypothetical protein EOM08_04195 [Clostridia bacterium]|nr:hypothetical protein [Clostridia bacterium]
MIQAISGEPVWIRGEVEAWRLHLPFIGEASWNIRLVNPEMIRGMLLLYGPDEKYLGDLAIGLPFRADWNTPDGGPVIQAGAIRGDYAFVFWCDPATLPEQGAPLILHLDPVLAKPLSGDAQQVRMFPAIQSAGNAGPKPEMEPTQSGRRRFYRGDLHAHTTWSDGHLTPEDAIKVMAQQKLDYLAVTDHNRVAQALPQTTVRLIPAVELTFPTGHINVHGLSRPDVLGFLSATIPPALADAVHWNAHSGAHVSINHPFMVPWDFTDQTVLVSQINSLEIICDPTYPGADQANAQAADFLDAMWARGYKVFGVGGSDSHQLPTEPYAEARLPSIYGDPCTYLAAASDLTPDLVAAMRQGHSYVSRYLSLDLEQDQGLIPGSAVAQDASAITWSLKIENFDDLNVLPEYEAIIYLNGEIFHREILTAANAQCLVTVPVQGEFGFSRISLFGPDQTLHAFVNPVHWGAKSPPDQPIGILMKEFLSRD